MLHPSTAFGWETLETLHSAAVAILKKLSDAHSPAAVAELERAVRGRDTTVYYTNRHNRSLGNVVPTDQPPGTGTGGSFYGPQQHFKHRSSCEFVICLSLSCWAAYDLFVADDVPTETNLLRFGCHRLCGYGRASPALSRTVCPYSNTASVSLHRMNTPYSAPFCVYRSEHDCARTSTRATSHETVQLEYLVATVHGKLHSGREGLFVKVEGCCD
jgi:hypothetical protein